MAFFTPWENPEKHRYAQLGLESTPPSLKQDYSDTATLTTISTRWDGSNGPRASQQRIFHPRVYWPAFILFGQVILIVGGWLFYTVTRLSPLPMSDSLAEWALHNPQTLTTLITLLSSSLSIISGFLYSRSIRYALTAFLIKPMSLFVVAATIQVAGMGPILNMTRMKWTLTALVCALVLGAQTAAWSTLLTPGSIKLSTKMEGSGLNLSAPTFSSIISDIAFAAPDTEVNIAPIVGDSGTAAINARLGLPASFHFQNFTFMNSTGGILPANLVNARSLMDYRATVPAQVKMEKPAHSPVGFGTNYTVFQQGLTAQVTCMQADIASLSTFATFGTYLNSSLVSNIMVAQCPNNPGTFNSTPAILSYSKSFTHAVYAVMCPTEAPDGSLHYDVVVAGTGNYYFLNTTICHITPLVTTANANYVNSPGQTSVALSKPHSIQENSMAGLYPFSVLSRLFAHTQTPWDNSIGDILSLFLINADQQTNGTFLNEILEAYITGVFEFGGTLQRAWYARVNTSTLLGANADADTNPIHEDMQMPMTGTFFTETMGWYHEDITTPVTLLAPTAVALASIIAVCAAIVHVILHPRPRRYDYFDPGDILHVVAAASSGGLHTGFPPFEANQDKHSQGVVVQLGPVGAGGTGRLGLVQQR